MHFSDRDTSTVSRSPAKVSRDENGEEWPVTRVLNNAPGEPPQSRDGETAAGRHKGDVGRQTAPNEFELFVSCDPGPALQQQFEFLRPVFITVHDIGTTSSRKLLMGIGAAAGRAVQRLVVRRQGYGTALATLHFVELQTNEGPLLRMYTTDCETEPGWREEITHLLLGFSRLAVVMVGNLAPQAIGPALRPLRERIAAGPWTNRHLLLLPLSSANTLVSHGMELAKGTPVNVRTTPQVSRPADAWGFISGSWARANERSAPAEPSQVALSPLFANGRRGVPGMRVPGPNTAQDATETTDTAPGVLTVQARDSRPGALKEAQHAAPGVAGNGASAPAAGTVKAASPTTAPDGAARGGRVADAGPVPAEAASAPARTPVLDPERVDMLRRYARQVSEIGGVNCCCVFDTASGSSIAYSGNGPGAAVLAAQGAALMGSIARSGHALGLGDSMSEAAITLDRHHLLARAVPGDSDLGVVALLDRASANLTLVRLQVLRLDAMFDEPGQ